GVPDAGFDGSASGGRLRLMQGRIDEVAAGHARIDREGLVATLAQVVRETTPSRIRTLEVAGTHGSDHADHVAVGALAVLAAARASSNAELVAYRGPVRATEPPNQLLPVGAPASAMLAHYDACARRCAACGEACTSIDDGRAAMLRRR